MKLEDEPAPIDLSTRGRVSVVADELDAGWSWPAGDKRANTLAGAIPTPTLQVPILTQLLQKHADAWTSSDKRAATVDGGNETSGGSFRSIYNFGE
ncbi:unnamed protein product [Protopolystoma xenopodis]|uniref:Uncharacterized protein n=1 Tax=Protopolystoma xenopodis TaxID=117903 RepID=A0A448XPU0_9PLAT|nr:unnamed protein product [Protopolystoma xenopodis]